MKSFIFIVNVLISQKELSLQHSIGSQGSSGNVKWFRIHLIRPFNFIVVLLCLLLRGHFKEDDTWKLMWKRMLTPSHAWRFSYSPPYKFLSGRTTTQKGIRGTGHLGGHTLAVSQKAVSTVTGVSIFFHSYFHSCINFVKNKLPCVPLEKNVLLLSLKCPLEPSLFFTPTATAFT